MKVVDAERTTYLGFPILITNRDITIFDPLSGRVLEVLRSMRSVRVFIRGYRNAP